VRRTARTNVRGGIIARLCDAHLFAFLSAAEPLGVVYMEAMAMEVPVIATDAGGVPELIDLGRNGLLVSPGRPDLAADAILTMMHDPVRARAMGAEGRRTVVERFSSAISASTLVEASRATEVGFHQHARGERRKRHDKHRGSGKSEQRRPDDGQLGGQ
jgi:hypothetical protein